MFWGRKQTEICLKSAAYMYNITDDQSKRDVQFFFKKKLLLYEEGK